MGDLELLIDLHRDSDRQGPGDDEATRLAIALSGLRGAPALKIADIGCGTGAAALVLAQELDAHVIAVDFVPSFLRQLEARAGRAGLGDRIETLAAAMEALAFEDNVFDAIWSEGAIYNMGFEAGIKAWRRFLKPGGILAVSELTWLTQQRPPELALHWQREYPEVATASAKMALLESHGYMPIGYFPLSQKCWLDNYYRPLQASFDAFLTRQGQAEAARAIIAAERTEIALYEQYAAYFGYGYYIARKIAD
ncbi:MAG: class I SAM-dependent methyltransferase [Sphingomonadales bacterium]